MYRLIDYATVVSIVEIEVKLCRRLQSQVCSLSNWRMECILQHLGIDMCILPSDLPIFEVKRRVCFLFPSIFFPFPYLSFSGNVGDMGVLCVLTPKYICR